MDTASLAALSAAFHALLQGRCDMDCLIGILVVGATAIAFITWAIARAASAIDDAFGEDERA